MLFKSSLSTSTMKLDFDPTQLYLNLILLKQGMHIIALFYVAILAAVLIFSNRSVDSRPSGRYLPPHTCLQIREGFSR